MIPLVVETSVPLNRPGCRSSVDVGIRKCVRKLHSRVQRSISMTSPVTTAYTRQQPEQLLKLLAQVSSLHRTADSLMYVSRVTTMLVSINNQLGQMLLKAFL